jgi:hypothetical protein
VSTFQSNPELFTALANALPLTFLEALAQGVPALHAEAKAEATGSPLIDEPESHYVLPHLRRAMFETLFRREATKAGMQAVCMPNKRETAVFTLVRSGPFLFTASHVSQPGGAVRSAAFRSERAALNELLEQDDMFPDALAAELKAADAGDERSVVGVYCILLYGGDVGSAVAPFMEFAFPTTESTSYVDRYSFGDVLIAARDIGRPMEENERDGAFPALKRVPKEGSSDQAASE